MDELSKAVVLLSGGMDSAVALWYALKMSDVTTVITIDYGQHGGGLELQASMDLVKYARDNVRMTSKFNHHAIGLQWSAPVSGLTVRGNSYGPDGYISQLTPGNDHNGTEIPFTFVPGRNLIMLGIAAAYAFNDFASGIYGGWTAVDSDYPDCRGEFLSAAQAAIRYALGGDDPLLINHRPPIYVEAPLLEMSKAEIVQLGQEMHVPWRLTRSCYSNTAKPCLSCDSCAKRMEAFLDAGMVDPLVDKHVWERYWNDN